MLPVSRFKRQQRAPLDEQARCLSEKQLVIVICTYICELARKSNSWLWLWSSWANNKVENLHNLLEHQHLGVERFNLLVCAPQLAGTDDDKAAWGINAAADDDRDGGGSTRRLLFVLLLLLLLALETDLVRFRWHWRSQSEQSVAAGYNSNMCAQMERLHVFVCVCVKQARWNWNIEVGESCAHKLIAYARLVASAKSRERMISIRRRMGKKLAICELILRFSLSPSRLLSITWLIWSGQPLD